MNSFLSNEINLYVDRAKEVAKKEKQLEKIRKEFTRDYSIDKIRSLTKNQYCIGYKKAGYSNYRTFCYRVDNELKELGEIRGSFANKFGIFYGETKEGSGIWEYRIVKKFGNDPDHAVSKITAAICKLIEAGDKGDEQAIVSSPLSKIFRYKILSTYYPKKYLAIFNEEHINEFLNELEVPYTTKMSMLDKQRLIVETKNKNQISAKWSNYVFMTFLYERISIPSHRLNKAKEVQKKADQEYNDKYQYNIGVTKKQWKNMLNDPNVFYEDDIAFLKDMYLCENHASSCEKYESLNGIPEGTYYSRITELANRVLNYTRKFPRQIINNNMYWGVLFWGNYTANNSFEWKIKPKLAEAMSEVFPDLVSSSVNEEMDDRLVDDIRMSNFDDSKLSGKYNDEIKAKPKKVIIKGVAAYKRSRNTALNALKIAHYKCEIDANHPTFKRRSNNQYYTEPHHLIPMSAQDSFKNTSIDTEENIVSLCSNCHNEIHYGKNAERLIRKLYEKRSKLLSGKKINITIDDLLKLYGIPSTKK